MLKESLKKYIIYEYIRDNNNITAEISNSKKLILGLMANNKETIEYCERKLLEEKHEVEDAIEGKHYHENMTKREILINEISQYIYWQIIIAVSKNISYEEFKEEEKINQILKNVDVKKLGEKENITVKEIILHDLEQMYLKDYLKEVV